MKQHTEQAFETAIEHHLTTAGGYQKTDRDSFDPDRGLFTQDVLAFIKKTQPKEWEYLEGIQKDKAETTLLDNHHWGFNWFLAFRSYVTVTT